MLASTTCPSSYWARARARLGGPDARLGRAIARLAPDIDRIEVGQPQRAKLATAARGAEAPDHRRTPAARFADTGSPLAVCAATTLLTHLLVPYFDLANIVMVFLLSGFGVAAWLGRGPAVLAAFMNVAAFDFFFVAPKLSFACPTCSTCSPSRSCSSSAWPPDN